MYVCVYVWLFFVCVCMLLSVLGVCKFAELQDLFGKKIAGNMKHQAYGSLHKQNWKYFGLLQASIFFLKTENKSDSLR